MGVLADGGVEVEPIPRTTYLFFFFPYFLLFHDSGVFIVGVFERFERG